MAESQAVEQVQKHKAEITASLKVASKALEQFNLRCHELDDLQVTIEGNIQQQIGQLQELLETRKAELIDQLQQLIQVKKKNLAAQKDEVETVHAKLASCLESLSQGEVMKMNKAQIKELTDNFKPDMLPSCELNVKFIASTELTQACQQFGDVYVHKALPEKCYATGKGLEVAKPSETATAVLHVIDPKGKACSTPVETLTCELVSESTDEKIDCSVKKTEASGQYEISYQATSRGSQYQLHIKVEGEHIKGSPFPVTVKLPVQKLGTPIKTIKEVRWPWGVAINQRGEIIVAESGGHCVSIFSPTGEKLRSFGSQGSGRGQFHQPCGVAVDGDGNILVVDSRNHRIQKFTSDGKFIKAVGKGGSDHLEFSDPIGIAINQKVYVADQFNARVQILNPDLTFSSSFGSRGSGSGQFSYLWDVACDSTGKVYVADGANHRIQVFTAEGQFLKKFGYQGSGRGQLQFPVSISIDSEDVLYVTDQDSRISVFTCEGVFLTSFGRHGYGPGQFEYPRGVAVDKNGVVYVSDQDNHRIQLF